MEKNLHRIPRHPQLCSSKNVELLYTCMLSWGDYMVSGIPGKKRLLIIQANSPQSFQIVHKISMSLNQIRTTV